METAIGQGSTVLQQTGIEKDVLRVAANLAGKEEFGTLILDRLGRIRSCGAPAEKIFGTGQVRMTGRPVSDFIKGLHLADGSPSYSARYLGYLGVCAEWRRFEAKNVAGIGFTVEVKLSRTVLDGEDVFLLNVHRLGATPCR